MGLKSFIKGKLKQREVRKLEPDTDFEFEMNYYGKSNIIEGFNFIYCNNYTEDFSNSTEVDRTLLSFISCVVSLPTEQKVLKDLSDFINHILNNSTPISLMEYNNFYVSIGLDNTQLFLRGDYLFYNNICKNIHNNIFTKYIRNNIFPDETFIETPNEYLDNMYNSINCPSKEVDILFIENRVQCEGFKPVIGLSINKNINNSPINLNAKGRSIPYPINNRMIIYAEIDRFTDEEISYLIDNVKHGDKLIDLLHTTNNDYSDIDEIIEE